MNISKCVFVSLDGNRIQKYTGDFFFLWYVSGDLTIITSASQLYQISSCHSVSRSSIVYCTWKRIPVLRTLTLKFLWFVVQQGLLFCLQSACCQWWAASCAPVQMFFPCTVMLVSRYDDCWLSLGPNISVSQSEEESALAAHSDASTNLFSCQCLSISVVI